MLPKEGDVLKFTNYTYTLKTKYTIYADFESFVLPLESGEEADASKTISSSFTKKSRQHVPCGYCFMVVNIEGEICHGPILYRAQDVREKIIEKFLEEVTDVGEILLSDMKDEIPMIALNEYQQKEFDEAKQCGLCGKDFVIGEVKCRHHSHKMGEFICATHKACNLNAKLPNFIPCLMHNLTGYDSHFIVQALGKCKRKIQCIANSSEKFLTISIGKIRFLDSLKFMNSSLDSLVQNLSDNTELETKI